MKDIEQVISKGLLRMGFKIYEKCQESGCKKDSAVRMHFTDSSDTWDLCQEHYERAMRHPKARHIRKLWGK